MTNQPNTITQLDSDTAMSNQSYKAALIAAGSVIQGVDSVLYKQARNVFCAIRPPGHHAGPLGQVLGDFSPFGSNGFCLFNNIAIGAAYAMTQYRNQGKTQVTDQNCVRYDSSNIDSRRYLPNRGQAQRIKDTYLGLVCCPRESCIKKVAILDLDVHHGNGTQQCVINTSPQDINIEQEHIFGGTSYKYNFYKPWLDIDDNQNIFFASTQAFGLSEPSEPTSYFYPASGETWDNKGDVQINANVFQKKSQITENGIIPVDIHYQQQQAQQEAKIQGIVKEEQNEATNMISLKQEIKANNDDYKVKQQDILQVKTEPKNYLATDNIQSQPKLETKLQKNLSIKIQDLSKNQQTQDLLDDVFEDPENEFINRGRGTIPKGAPRIINVGIPGPGPASSIWRRAWRDKILPALVNFQPDLIFISAGFDAHKRDTINHSFVGLTERDYEWVTEQIVQVANRCCDGRIVSALEGGYAIEGCITSPLARSVAIHVQCLSDYNFQKWDQKEASIERKSEKLQKILKEKQEAAYALKLQQEQQHLKQQHTETFDTISRDNIVEGPRKRRQGTVDYNQLNQQLELEKKQKK